MSNDLTKARSAALYVLSRCRRFDAWSQQTLQKAAEKFSLDSRDNMLCTRLCLSVLQNASLCDYYIGCYSSVPVSRLEPQVTDILRLGVCQMLFMDKIPVSAAVHQSVELCKRSAPKAAGLVNAVLRRIGENLEHLPAIPGMGTAEELSVRYSHPLWLCEKIVKEQGYDFARAYLETNNLQPGVTLSVNLCRTDTVRLKEQLCLAGVEAEVNKLSPLSVDVKSGGNVTGFPGFAEGDFFVQDAAAAMSVQCAAPKPGMRVLDACAAPGGKSFLCASLMGDSGEILSCDLHAKKLQRVEESAERMGFRSIRTAPMDASKPYANLLNSFDLVLADVPCSGMGVIRKKPEIRYKPQADIEKLPEVQLRILNGLAGCVRPGGTLLYSTCTVLPEENEGVIRSFLSGNPGFSMEVMHTIWPQQYDTDGFYYCRMKRNA